MTQLTVRMGSEPEAAGMIDDLDGSSAMGVKLLDLFLHIVVSKQKKNNWFLLHSTPQPFAPGPAQDLEISFYDRHQM